MATPSQPTSEMRRSAKALVGTRTQSFESIHDEAVSREKLAGAIARAATPRFFVHAGEWKTADGKPVYEATFKPAPRVRRLLHGIGLTLFALIAASIWAAFGGTGPIKVALPMLTLLVILAMPLVVNAIASQREAEESRLTRAIRAALRDESEAFPPRQRWADED